jgi:hypothetical protein
VFGLGAVGLSAMLIGSCSHAADKDDACKNANYAIASRTQACTGDAALANQRYENVDSEYKCITADVDLPQYLCASAIDNLTCEQITVCGEDYDCWYAASSECALIFQHADGSALPTPQAGPLSPDLDASPACTEALQAMGARWGACIAAPFSLEQQIRDAFKGKFGCAGAIDSKTEDNLCLKEIPSVPCADGTIGQQQHATDFRNGAPSCVLLFPELKP